MVNGYCAYEGFKAALLKARSHNGENLEAIGEEMILKGDKLTFGQKIDLF